MPLGWFVPTSCLWKTCPGGRWCPCVLPWGHSLPGSMPRPPNPPAAPVPPPAPVEGGPTAPTEPPANSSCHRYCCVLLLKAMPCVSPAHSSQAAKVPPKQCLLLEIWLWPLRLQAMTVPQITPGGLPWLVGGWSSCFIRY